MVPLMRDLGLPSASQGSLGVKLRWFGPPLPVRVLLVSPCFLSLAHPSDFARSRELFLYFSHLSLNLSTDVISQASVCKKENKKEPWSSRTEVPSQLRGWWRFARFRATTFLLKNLQGLHTQAVLCQNTGGFDESRRA